MREFTNYFMHYLNIMHTQNRNIHKYDKSLSESKDIINFYILKECTFTPLTNPNFKGIASFIHQRSHGLKVFCVFFFGGGATLL